jgi:hypothetical protein
MAIRHTTVKYSEIVADPTHRLDAAYWIAKHATAPPKRVCAVCGVDLTGKPAVHEAKRGLVCHDCTDLFD